MPAPITQTRCSATPLNSEPNDFWTKQARLVGIWTLQ